MGAFYTNITLRGPAQRDVVNALRGRDAFVSPTTDGCTVVYDAECDEQDQNIIGNLAAALSSRLHCPVLAVLNHDDDIFWYQLYNDGELADEYDSSPGYFDGDAKPSAPTGGDAVRLCAAFGSSNVDEVDRVLRRSSFDEEGYVFATERHSALAEALGLPEYSVGFGYRYIAEGKSPDGLKRNDLIEP